MQSRLVVATLGLLLVVSVGAGCATSPAPPEAATPPLTESSQQAQAQPSHHSHHAHHHGGAQPHSGPQPPTSFAERPEVGTEFTCPVSGGVFEVEPRTRVSFYKGRYYAMCCGGCAQDFDADPAHFVEALKRTESAASYESH